MIQTQRMAKDLGTALGNILWEKYRNYPWLIIHYHRSLNNTFLIDMGEDKLRRMYAVLEEYGIKPSIAALNEHQKPVICYRFFNRKTNQEEYWDFHFEWVACNEAARLQIDLIPASN